MIKIANNLQKLAFQSSRRPSRMPARRQTPLQGSSPPVRQYSQNRSPHYNRTPIQTTPSGPSRPIARPTPIPAWNHPMPNTNTARARPQGNTSQYYSADGRWIGNPREIMAEIQRERAAGINQAAHSRHNSFYSSDQSWRNDAKKVMDQVRAERAAQYTNR